MAQYQIPQFIETESRLVGPFTFKQFIYIAIGAVIIFLLQYTVSLGTLIIIAIPIAAMALALAFFRIDGVPLPKYIAMAFSFLLGTKKYIYHDNSTFDVSNIIKKK